MRSFIAFLRFIKRGTFRARFFPKRRQKDDRKQQREAVRSRVHKRKSTTEVTDGRHVSFRTTSKKLENAVFWKPKGIQALRDMVAHSGQLGSFFNKSGGCSTAVGIYFWVHEYDRSGLNAKSESVVSDDLSAQSDFDFKRQHLW